MANALYTIFKNGLMNQLYDLDDDTLKVALLNDTYSVDLVTNTDYATFASSAQIATDTLAGGSISAGVFDASDHVFSSVTTGLTIAYIVIYHDSTGQLIAYFDTDSGGTIGTDTNGGDVTVTWNASGIFGL